MRFFDFVRLPEGLVQIGLLLQEQAGRRRARLYVAGPHDHPLIDPFPPSTVRMWGIEFEAAATLDLLGVPLSSLAGAPIFLEDVWGQPARILAERMEACRSSAAKLSVLQTALIARKLKSDAGRGTGQVGAALRSIEASHGDLRVGALANDLGLSARQLQRIFAEHVGLSPKRYAQVIRFRRALSLASSASPVDWASWAVGLGYSDQSHLIDDFREQLGSTPERLRLHGDFIEGMAPFGWFITPKIAAVD